MFYFSYNFTLLVPCQSHRELISRILACVNYIKSYLLKKEGGCLSITNNRIGPSARIEISSVRLLLPCPPLSSQQPFEKEN